MSVATNSAAQFDQMNVCPSLDTYLQQSLSPAHLQMYEALVRVRLEAEGNQYPVAFDALWREVGFSMKHKAKKLLDSTCTVGNDFCSVNVLVERDIGATSREDIRLTLDAAQRFALLAGTSRSREIADFFVKTLKAVQEYHILTLRFENRQAITEATEQSLLMNTPKGKKMVYFGDIGIINGEHLFKGGSTDDIPQRVTTLKQTFPNGFTLVHVTEHADNREVERQFKAHPDVRVHQRDVTCSDHTYTECYKLDQRMTMKKYVKILKGITKNITAPVGRDCSHEERMKELELETEKQRTLQVQYQSSQTEHQEKTKQMDLELEMMRLKLLVAKREVDEPAAASPAATGVRSDQEQKQEQVGTLEQPIEQGADQTMEGVEETVVEAQTVTESVSIASIAAPSEGRPRFYALTPAIFNRFLRECTIQTVGAQGTHNKTLRDVLVRWLTRHFDVKRVVVAREFNDLAKQHLFFNGSVRQEGKSGGGQAGLKGVLLLDEWR